MSFNCVLNVTGKNLKTRPKRGQRIDGEVCRFSRIDVDIPKLERHLMTPTAQLK